MLQYEIAKQKYEEIKERAARTPGDDFKEFYQDFLRAAIDYANTRATWSCMSVQECVADDVHRTIKHDAFMAILTAVCRNLVVQEIDELMPERKAKGDFACYIALFLSLEQR